MSDAAWGLQMTVLGMGLVFGLLTLLWGLLTLVQRFEGGGARLAAAGASTGASAGGDDRDDDGEGTGDGTGTARAATAAAGAGREADGVPTADDVAADDVAADDASTASQPSTSHRLAAAPPAFDGAADGLDDATVAAIVTAVLAHRALLRREAAPAMRRYWPGSLLYASRWLGAGRARQNHSWQGHGRGGR